MCYTSYIEWTFVLKRSLHRVGQARITYTRPDRTSNKKNLRYLI